MKYGILYNLFCCWIVSVIAAVAARHILLYRDRHDLDRTFGLFWMAAAVMWFFSGLRLIFYYAGLLAIDRWIFYVVQVLVVLQIFPGGMHGLLKITANRRAVALITAALFFFQGGYLFFVFYDGVRPTGFTAWTSEYTISPNAFACFLPVCALAVVGNLWDLAAKIVNFRNARNGPREHTYASVALLIYIAAGIVDTKGALVDWRLVLIRACFMIAALISYTAYSWDTRPDFVRDTVERSDF